MMTVSKWPLSVSTLFLMCLSWQIKAKNEIMPDRVVKQVAVIKVLEKNNVLRKLIGVVFSPDNQTLSSEVSGIVRSERLALGTLVKKGDVIIELDNREAKAQESIAVAETERAQIGVKRKQSSFNRAQKTYSNKLASKVEFEEAELELQQAKSDLKISNARLQLATLNVEKYTIVAPFSGSLINSTPSYGKQIMLGESIVEIINHDNLIVRAYFSAHEMRKLKRQEAQLKLHSESHTYLQLLQNASATRSKNGMFETEFSLPKHIFENKFNNNSDIPAHFARYDFYSGQAIKLQLMEERLLVPQRAISEDGNGEYVLAVVNDVAVRVPISEIQIGQKVIIMGHQDLLPSDPVESLILSETQ